MNNEDFANAYLSYVQNEQSTMQLKSTLIPKIKFGETLDDYEIIKTIGKGSTGSVLKVISKNDGETYALKKIETKHLGKDNLHRLWKEVAALKELQHPHIIKYYHSFIDDNYLCIVTEFARHGDLDKWLKKQYEKKCQISERDVWEILWQVGLALLHIHAHSLIHRDVKALNILIIENKTFKLADLGECRFISAKNLMEQAVGTPLYMAPEIFKKEKYDQRVDVWSLGVVLYTMLSLEYPFNSNDIQDLSKQIMHKAPRMIVGPYSDSLTQLVMKMLNKNKEKRPFMDEIISMFPPCYQVKLTVDIDNVRNYEKSEIKLKEKSIIDRNLSKINVEFDEIKNRILVKKKEFHAYCMQTRKDLFATSDSRSSHPNRHYPSYISSKNTSMNEESKRATKATTKSDIGAECIIKDIEFPTIRQANNEESRSSPHIKTRNTKTDTNELPKIKELLVPCATMHPSVPLKTLHRKFGIKEIHN